MSWGNLRSRAIQMMYNPSPHASTSPSTLRSLSICLTVYLSNGLSISLYGHQCVCLKQSQILLKQIVYELKAMSSYQGAYGSGNNLLSINPQEDIEYSVEASEHYDGNMIQLIR
jgi:hypothetical protein